MCARSCTFFDQGMSYRDTDWYDAHAAGGWVTMTGRGEFPLMVILIHGTNCANLQYVYDQAARCEDAEVQFFMAPEAEVWLWAGPAVFEGVPESDYILEICGIADDPVPVQWTSWGRIKQRFGTAK